MRRPAQNHRWTAAVLMVALSTLASAAPPVVWSSSYDGPAHAEDKPTGMVVDQAGNSFVTGYSFGDSTDYDFATVSFDSLGRITWARRYGSPLRCEDRPWCIGRDSSGAIVVSGGSIADLSVGWDFQTIKYTPGGDTAWLRRLDLGFAGDDKPAALAVGPGNSVYVAGASRRRPVSGGRSDWDISLVKYSAVGETLWTRRYDGASRLDDYAAAVATDEAGNVYVAGKSVVTAPAPDIILLKYRPGGTLAWHREIDGQGRSADMAAAVLLDRAGRVYVAGSVTGAATSFDFLAACFDTNGNRLWLDTYDGAGRVDIVTAACLDPDGMVLTGQSTGSATSFDIATVKYSASGSRLWTRRYNSARNSADRGWCVAADRRGNVFVGGNSVGASPYPDILLLGYSREGDTVFELHLPGSGAGEARPIALGLVPRPLAPPDLLPCLLVAGHTFSETTGFDYLLALIDPARPAADRPKR